ncbi:MAG: VWA domain-containing protein [Acidobacteria bacterium]|nr:MAG: VWA domain-containing protein [Acidobacteriota bacterium]
MFKRVCLLAFLILTLLVIGFRSSFSQRPIPGTIRVDVTAIPVDVIVTDSQGRPVTGLSAADFVVLEEGVRQEISHFSTRGFGPGAPSVPQVAPKPAAPDVFVVPVLNYRNFVIVLGRGRHAQNFDTMKQLTAFVSQLGPQDHVAVVAYGRATAFTTDHRAILMLLERFTKENPYIETMLEGSVKGLAAIYGTRKVPPKVQERVNRIFDVEQLHPKQALNANLAQLEGQRENDRQGFEVNQQAEVRRRGISRDQTTVETTTRQTAPATVQGHGISEFDLLKLSHITDLPFEEYLEKRGSTSQDLENIFSAIEYVRFMEGEKHLLFLTGEGLFLPNLEDDDSLASTASDARVRVHVVQTAGMDIRNPVVRRDDPFAEERPGYDLSRGRGGSYSMMFALTTLHKISELTGGQAFTRTDIGEAFRSIGAATSFVYSLAYRPLNRNFDGKFRRIEVGTRQTGLRVYARRGYYARPTLEPYDRERFMIYARTVAAAQYPGNVKDIPLDVDIEKTRIGGGRLEVTVKARIKVKETIFDPKGDAMTGLLAVNYFIVADDGQMKAEAWNTLNMNLSQASYQEALRQGVVAQETFEIDPGPVHARLKLIVYNPKTDTLGCLIKPAW